MKGPDLFGYFDVPAVESSEKEEAEAEPGFDATVLSIVECEDGPRIVDVSLGLALGYDRPRNIRNLIDRYRSQLNEFGKLLHREAVYSPGSRGTKPKEYLLNQGQVNYLVTRSSLPNADEACVLIAKVFTAWQNGKLTTTDLATAVELRDAEERLSEDSPQIRDLFNCLAQCATKKDLQSTEINLSRKIEILAGRQYPTPRTWAIHLDVVRNRYGSLCPCCGKIMIVDASGVKVSGVCQWDHWHKVTKAGLREGWPVCIGCNRMLEAERTSYAQEFGVFIKRVIEAETATDPMLSNDGVALVKGMEAA